MQLYQENLHQRNGKKLQFPGLSLTCINWITSKAWSRDEDKGCVSFTLLPGSRHDSLYYSSHWFLFGFWKQGFTMLPTLISRASSCVSLWSELGMIHQARLFLYVFKWHQTISPICFLLRESHVAQATLKPVNVAEDDLVLLILLPPLSKLWDYRHVPTYQFLQGWGQKPWPHECKGNMLPM